MNTNRSSSSRAAVVRSLALLLLSAWGSTAWAHDMGAMNEAAMQRQSDAWFAKHPIRGRSLTTSAVTDSFTASA